MRGKTKGHLMISDRYVVNTIGAIFTASLGLIFVGYKLWKGKR